MNLVSAAMRRPVTIIVGIVAVVLCAFVALRQMPRDILPTLGIPVIYVAQPFGGLDPAQMEGYVTYYYEYHFLYITGIENVESKSIQGIALIKLQFHPGTDMAQALAETINYANRARAFMPPGTVPPFVMRFDAGSVPVGDLVFTSESRTVGELQDLALNRVRPLFATLRGVSAPPPFGASQRTIVVRVDPQKLRTYNISIDELVDAVNSANTISPSGNALIGNLLPMVPVNSIVRNIKELEKVPIHPGRYPAVFVRDIATVEDSTDIPTGFALVNGKRTVYIPVTKRADASTLEVVRLVKENLPTFQKVLPDDVKVTYAFDQSPYVIRAINGLMIEGTLGAILTGVMVLLFLRDWRSALIVVINIPLSLLGAIVALWLTGQTVNIMTLGGLALAIGILVDMSTVTIENIHTHLARGESLARAVADSGREVALPLFISMLCVLAVFVPSFFMSGAAKALFVPLSLAVGFSMVASYLLSSSFVPILSMWILRRQHSATKGKSFFERVQEKYGDGVQRVMARRGALVVFYLAGCVVVIVLLLSGLGREIFPTVDVGQFELRFHAPTGTKIEATEQIASKIMDAIRGEVGADNVETSVGFVGVQPPNYPINTIYLWTSGSEEGVLQVQLKRGTRVRVEELKERLRRKFAGDLSDVRVSFEPSDIVSRVMSLGALTPIEVAVSGPDINANRDYAEKLRRSLSNVAALRDVQFGQALDYPTVEVTMDRERAGILGVTSSRLARALTAATSSSRYVVPNYWADPTSGIAYQVQVEVPQQQMNSVEEVKNIPVSTTSGGTTLPLRNVAQVEKGVAAAEYDRFNSQRMITLNANISGADLGSVAAQLTKAMKQAGATPPKVNSEVRGQIVPLQQMLTGLEGGLLLAIVVIFLLLAANFQSLKLAFVVMSTAPAVIAGVAIALWLTRTTLNIQSFMGAIMAIGVAVANAILLVTFAERSRIEGKESDAAAIEGARSRLRPILMTSFAMIAGMIPMALGLGEGGEQTAPLGRAVVGGLAAATIATLFILPLVFAMVQRRTTRKSVSLDPDDPNSSTFEEQRANHHARATS
jgi:multidrug efflux pump subunit AcrB